MMGNAIDILNENCLKVKSISKVRNKKYNKPESENPESAEAESAEQTDKMRKVKGMTKLKSVKKIKNIIDIDDDLALKMKKEVEEGDRPGSHPTRSESGEVVMSGGEAEPPGEVGSEAQAAKIDRILKMFNASSLDDIIEVTPIKSIKEVDPDKLSIRDIPDDRGGSFCKYIPY